MTDQSAQPPSVAGRLSAASQQLLNQQPSGQVPQVSTDTQQAPQSVPSDPNPPSPQNLSNPQETLALFEQALTEAESMQSANDQSQSPQQSPVSTPAQTGGMRKEHLETNATSSTAAELPGGMQYVETEPNPEIPPEVESYLSEVEQNPDQQPQEIVIAAPVKDTYQPPPPKTTVRVLPITKEEAEAARRKSPGNSIRWLYEFSQKLTKMFFQGVIYRQEVDVKEK